MCDVDRHNFSSLLPLVSQLAGDCAFYAIDTEFTMLHSDNEGRPRYARGQS